MKKAPRTFKTSELTGAALDLAVAKIIYQNSPIKELKDPATKRVLKVEVNESDFSPSSNPVLADPIIATMPGLDLEKLAYNEWEGIYTINRQGKTVTVKQTGCTREEAAMRCLVAMELGESFSL